jgi:hypothetical protein
MPAFYQKMAVFPKKRRLEEFSHEFSAKPFQTRTRSVPVADTANNFSVLA